MNTNIGGLERVMRVLVGIGIVSMAFLGPKTPWAFFGLVPLVTGLIGWCPPYALLGHSSCKKCNH